MILGIVAVVYGATYIWMHRLFGGANLVERLLRTRYMNHFADASAVFERNRTGDLMAKATNDLRSVANCRLRDARHDRLYHILDCRPLCHGLHCQLALTLAILPMPIIAIGMVIYGRAIHKRYTGAGCLR